MRKVYYAKVAIILAGKDAAPLLVLNRVSPLHSESFILFYALCTHCVLGQTIKNVLLPWSLP